MEFKNKGTGINKVWDAYKASHFSKVSCSLKKSLFVNLYLCPSRLGL